MGELDLTDIIEAHHPIKGGTRTSNIPGSFSGDWVICSCEPGVGPWHEGAGYFPIETYPQHILTAAAPLIAAQVRDTAERDLYAALGRDLATFDTWRSRVGDDAWASLVSDVRAMGAELQATYPAAVGEQVAREIEALSIWTTDGQGDRRIVYVKDMRDACARIARGGAS